MYLLDHTTQDWDTDFFHTLMGEKRIFSSDEAKKIRTKLNDAGALPPFDGHYDWAMLCIGYCFAKGFTDSPGKLIAAPNTKGTEISSFQTCFQEYSRLWLVMLSDALFRLHPEKKATKEDLYALIHNLWHTGAVELDKLWEGCKRFKPDSELAARQAFIKELTDLAIKNAGLGKIASTSEGDTSPMPSENQEHQEQRLRTALARQNIPVAELKFSHAGVRYDIYRLRLTKHTELDKYHQALCSELGIQESALHIVRCYNNESHAYDMKLLRDEKSWQKLGANAFAEALKGYNQDYILPICIGIDEYGKAHFQDLTSAPHLLIGGATGSGKSVLVRTLLRSLFDLNKGQDKMEVAILDPKKVDYRPFENEEDLYEERILDDYDEMYDFLVESVEESERRYELMRQHRVEKLSQLPDSIRPHYRVIVVDEVANLLKQHDGIERQLIMLAEKARAAGIHLILCTQRPDSKVLSGELRTNLPSRIALQVQKSTESKIILDEVGAEQLLGKGDHLVRWNNGAPLFLHGFNL